MIELIEYNKTTTGTSYVSWRARRDVSVLSSEPDLHFTPLCWYLEVITFIIMCGCNNLSIPKLQRLYRWSLEMDKQFHCILSWMWNCLSMLGLNIPAVCHFLLCWTVTLLGSPLRGWCCELLGYIPHRLCQVSIQTSLFWYMISTVAQNIESMHKCPVFKLLITNKDELFYWWPVLGFIWIEFQPPYTSSPDCRTSSSAPRQINCKNVCSSWPTLDFNVG